MGNSATTNSNQNTANNSATNSNSATNYGSNTGSNTAQNTAQTSNTQTASGPSAAGQALINAGTGTQNTLGNLSSFMSPYTQSVLNSQVALENQQNAAQQNQLTGNAIAQGALGGDRQQAQSALLAGQQQLANNATNTGILQQGYNTALGAAQTQAAQNLQGASLSGTQSSTGTQQLGSTAGQQASTTLGGTNTAQSTAQASTGATAGSSTTQQNPGLLSYAGLGAGLLQSDERVKENIEPVGKTFDGQTIHKFNYVGNPTTHIGLLAQEVEHHHPAAVHSIGGLKMVNYDDATKGAAHRGHFADGGGIRGFADGGTVPVTYNGQVYYVPQSTASMITNSSGGDISPAQAFSLGQSINGALTGTPQSNSGAGVSSIGNMGSSSGGMSPDQAYRFGSQLNGGLNTALYGSNGAAPTSGLATNVGNSLGSLASSAGGFLSQAFATGGAASASGSGSDPSGSSIGALPSSAFYTPVSFAPVQASMPSVPAPAVSMPSIAAPSVAQAQMPTITPAQTSTESTGKGSLFAGGGAVKRRPDGGGVDTESSLANVPFVVSSGPADLGYGQNSTPTIGDLSGNAPYSPLTAPAPATAAPAPAPDARPDAASAPSIWASLSPVGTAQAAEFPSDANARDANVTAVSKSGMAPQAPAAAPQTLGAPPAAPAPISAAPSAMLRADTLSSSTLDFIKAKEGFSATPYDDHKQTSIGYGTEALPGEASITPDAAEARLRDKTAKVNAWIDNNVKVPITQNQRTALTSFGYNLGTGEGGLRDLLPKVNSGDWKGAADQMGRYIHAGGDVIPALIKRRNEEMSLLTQPDGAQTGPSTIGNLYSKLSSAFQGNAASLFGPPPPAASGTQGASSSAHAPGGVLGVLNALGVPMPASAGDVGSRIAAMAPLLLAVGSNNPSYLTAMTEPQLKQQQLDLERLKTAYETAKPVETGAVPTVVTDPLGIPHIVNVPHMVAPVVDPATGKVTFPAPLTTGTTAGTGTGGGSAEPQPDYKFGSKLRGQDYLNYAQTQNPQAASYAADVFAGRESMPNIAKEKPGIALLVSNMVRQADPDYNANRYKYAQQYMDPKGKVQLSTNALETALHHVEVLHDANANGNVSETYTAPTNWLWHGLQRGYGATGLENYDSTASAFGREFDKVLTGGVGASGEREASEARVSSTKPTEARMSGNAANVELMLGKMLSYENDWRKNQGPNVPPPPSLTGDERAIVRKVFDAEPDSNIKKQRYKRLIEDPRTADLVSPPNAPASTGTPAASAPIPTATGVNGEKYFVQNGKWVRR